MVAERTSQTEKEQKGHGFFQIGTQYHRYDEGTAVEIRVPQGDHTLVLSPVLLKPISAHRV